MASNREVWEHKRWLGYLQPEGLVVSPPALIEAQCVPNANVHEAQTALQDVCFHDPQTDRFVLNDFSRFSREVLGWQPGDLACFDREHPAPAHLEVVLTDYGETLRPDQAVVDGDETLMLVRVLPTETPLEAPRSDHPGGWHASPRAKFERLLRETGVAVGLLCNGAELCLKYAPKGESAGWLVFPIPAMTEVAGREILAACIMLLEENRVFSAPAGRRLHDILAASRKIQSEVSTRLAEQVLAALNDLLRGFQTADELVEGQLIGRGSGLSGQQVYGGLLTVVMRSVFLLYAEDAGLMSNDPLYVRHYALTGLFEQLREDANRYPDTMDQRYGAWSRMISLFRLVHAGGGHGGLQLPARAGQLFDPDAHGFLEGRSESGSWNVGEVLDLPRVADGAIYRLLRNLLILDGERLSYRALDVEQIGSVYEAMMGYDIERARGVSIAVRPHHVFIDLEEVLRTAPAKRSGLLKAVKCELKGKAATALKNAQTIDDLVGAIGRRRSPRTPEPLPREALYLQPGEERRRTGSHYTPRSLTGPIVTDTLAPILRDLGPKPKPEAILELKVCDPAMGSGAFLVETCRQVAQILVTAWDVHDALPDLPPDEDPLLHARRLIAQRCLYGVDKNPFAVNLAKLSLWLVTLARNHPFTFLDHALKCGDSLIGLRREQIGAFHWLEQKDHGPLFEGITSSVDEASRYRKALHALGDAGDPEKRRLHWEAESELHDARLAGDLVVAAFFDGKKTKDRKEKLTACRQVYDVYKTEGKALPARDICDQLRDRDKPVVPFHWDIEFPEVFDRANPGFDAFVGNPPFAGKNTTAAANAPGFPEWLQASHRASHGNSDIVAHFFRTAFDLLRRNGSFGLIATNTIGQGDTRTTGLRWICTHGGAIYKARKRIRWPGAAAVVVSVVHVYKGDHEGPYDLDGRSAPMITAFLFHAGGHETPKALEANKGKSFVGSYVLGMGFTFDDTDKKGIATPIAEMHRLIEKDPRNAERIFPYIGGKELNTNPTLKHHRYVIDFGEMSEGQARQWPDLYNIVQKRVKPERALKKDKGAREKWWQFIRPRPELRRALFGLDRAMVIARISQTFAFTFIASNQVINEKIIVFPSESLTLFANLQARVHEVWSRLLSTTLKDDLQYTPSDCFDTFPLLPTSHVGSSFENIPKKYLEMRNMLMKNKNIGLTQLYNFFHNSNCCDQLIIELRELHEAMDKAVLTAYGWDDIPTNCEFLLDYEIDDEAWPASKKKPYRLCWPDEVRDEVLARLLDLNQKRYAEEKRKKKQAEASQKAKPTVPKEPIAPKTRGRKKKDTPGQTGLFEGDENP